MVIARVISGGQTGADRGALLAAIRLQIPHGGFCPRGRLAEDGMIPPEFLLEETQSDKYGPRTAANVKLADATLVLSKHGIFDRGTGFTLRLIDSMEKPYVRLSLDCDQPERYLKQVQSLKIWLRQLSHELGRTLVINVAGPRESRIPGLQLTVESFLVDVLNDLKEGMSDEDQCG